MSRRALAGLGALLLGACAVTPPMPDPPATHPASPRSPSSPAGPKSSTLEPVIPGAREAAGEKER